ncbi:MAG: hypothetical protein CM1200mP14_08770 [Gammaproteobacteria bacterium]|nr:MAG: hypothetical protein CM1200mP14_08770 [Gammaproteobacteria bacterium]
MIPVERRKTVAVNIDGVVIGGTAPVVVQSMTNTDTADVTGTVTQIRQLVDAGSELVRVTVNNEDAARAVPEIVSQLRKVWLSDPNHWRFPLQRASLAQEIPRNCDRPL